jgi:hypothetical protein
MLDETPPTSLPQRTWIDKFTPETLEAYINEPEPSSPLRQANTVWSDEFGSIIGPLLSSDHQRSSSRRQFCRPRSNALQFHHSEFFQGGSDSLVQGLGPSHLLADDCFLDRMVEGVGIMVVAVVVLGAMAALVWRIWMRLRARRVMFFRLCRPLLVAGMEGSKTKGDAVGGVDMV